MTKETQHIYLAIALLTFWRSIVRLPQQGAKHELVQHTQGRHAGAVRG